MHQTKKTRINQDVIVVVAIGLVLITGLYMVYFAALNNLSFLAVLGVSISFWSVLLLFFTPTKKAFLLLLKASASSSGSNIERTLLEFNLTEKGVYLPPQNLHSFESSLIFVPNNPNTPLPTAEEPEDKLLSKKRNGLLFNPPGLALSLMFEHELDLSFRKIPLTKMEAAIKKLINNLKFAEGATVQIQNNTIHLEITGSIFNTLCNETREKQPRTHAQIGCILPSAFACAFAKASDKPIIIQKHNLNPENKTLIIEYLMENV